MISEESLRIMADSYAAMNHREEWSRILIAWARTFEHRWVNEKIVHPLPLQESKERRKVLNQGHLFMAWHYHVVVLEGDVSKCQSCRLGHSGHDGWQIPFK